MGFFSNILGLLTGAPGKADDEAGPVFPANRSFAPSDSIGPAMVEVLLAPLDGPAGHDVSVVLAEDLAARNGIDLKPSKKPLRLGPGKTLGDRLMAAAEVGRGWLSAESADILVWGEAVEGGVILRFLPRQTEAEGRPGTFGMGDTLELPRPLTGDLLDLVYAGVLAAAVPTVEADRRRLPLILTDAVLTVDRLVDTPPPHLTPVQAVSALNALGNALATLWRVTGEGHRLDRAILAYETALSRGSVQEMPVPWGLTQNHLAAALEAKGEADTKDSAPLERAAAAYTSVIETLGRADHPYDWAAAQVRLGMVLYRLGARSGKAAELKAAATALEAALGVYTRTAMPGRWSEVMNQYGVVLMALGEQVSGAAPLERAVLVFRKAMEVRRRDAAPLLWAQTANNLGAGSFALAKRNGDTALMKEAVACFEGAIEVYRETGRNKTVMVIEKNLHRVERLLKSRE